MSIETHISAHGNVINSRDDGLIDDERRARLDAMRHIARDVPDPETYARRLAPELALLLVNARTRRGSLRVTTEAARRLKPFGLVEAGQVGTKLTAFGMKVRRALLEEDA